MNASVLRGGANARTDGARKRMPVMKRSLAVMPSVAKGVRTHAWNTCAPPSGMGWLSRERADLRHEVLRNAHAVTLRALAVRAAPFAGQAHFIIRNHHLDEGLDALLVHGL